MKTVPSCCAGPEVEMFTRLWVVVRGWGQTRATGIAPSVVVEIVELAISLPDVGSGVGCCDVETMDDVVP